MYRTSHSFFRSVCTSMSPMFLFLCSARKGWFGQMVFRVLFPWIIFQCVKAAGNTKVAGERSKKAQSSELLKSVAVSVSLKLKKIACYNKTNNRKIRDWIGRTENPKKQGVSQAKSSVLRSKQHNNQHGLSYITAYLY